MGAYVSHQHVPKKNAVPKSQPSRNERHDDAFSRSMAQISGTRANHARNQISKSGKASMSSPAAMSARRQFFQDGKYVTRLTAIA